MKGDYEMAMKVYGSALEVDPSNIQVLTNRAACHINLKEYTLALQDCKVARLYSL